MRDLWNPWVEGISKPMNPFQWSAGGTSPNWILPLEYTRNSTSESRTTDEPSRFKFGKRQKCLDSCDSPLSHRGLTCPKEGSNPSIPNQKKRKIWVSSPPDIPWKALRLLSLLSPPFPAESGESGELTRHPDFIASKTVRVRGTSQTSVNIQGWRSFRWNGGEGRLTHEHEQKLDGTIFWDTRPRKQKL